VDTVGAKRVMFDTLEALFTGFSNPNILRAELRRLFLWLKERNLTAIVTAERGEGTLTREGLEEYVSDCVILLDHRIKDQISARRMRIVKYRGTKHGADEYPFLIDEKGMSILPLTALQLRHKVSDLRVSTGIPDLDEMLEGKGYYRGSSVLVSGTAGSGKTTLGASFVDAACRRGERCLFIDFEQSSDQVTRNMKSVGINLEQWREKGLLFHEAWRPTQSGIEMHLLRIHKLIETIKPDCVVVDPITNLGDAGDKEVYSMLLRLLDFLKEAGITAMFISLTGGGEMLEQTRVGVSSLADTWILLRDVELNGERNRVLYVLKSRGMEHSNQLREFIMTDRGIHLVPAYIGSGGVVTGSSRVTLEAKEKLEGIQRRQEAQRKKLQIEQRSQALQAQIAHLQSEFEAVQHEREQVSQEESETTERLTQDRKDMAKSRTADN
jgi:circadian clock protein KaiC